MKSYKRNIKAGVGLLLLFLIITSVASYMSINALLKSSRLVNHTNIVIQEIDGVMLTMKEAESAQRGFLLSGNEAFLDHFNGSSEKVFVKVENIKTLTADNSLQQNNIEKLKNLLTQGFNYLEGRIDLKRGQNEIQLDSLWKDRRIMDEVRIAALAIQTHERNLLISRTATMNKYAGFTPALIIFTALLSLLITILFYRRITNDIDEKTELQQDVEYKEQKIRKRISIIQGVAEQISSGDYKIRLKDEEKDDLGSLAESLNKMAESLEKSFAELKNREWIQGGIARLNKTMVGEKEISTLTTDILEYIAGFTNSQVGAFYLSEGKTRLKLISGFALDNLENREYIAWGEGLAGQCALSARQIIIRDIPEGSLTVSFASGEAKPVNIIAVPVLYEQQLMGVIELGSISPFSDDILQFISYAENTIGIAINSSQIRKRQQELLEETQTQSEELQAQHSELENLNTELEAQTQKIQASEEELKVQQEELLQSNQELEEGSRLLEERNQIIVERNLEIKQKADQLELSTKYKSEFLANMSHELRTPLNSILLLSRLMTENKDLGKEEVEYAGVIQSAGQGLLTLIDEILDLSKIESGKMDLESTRLGVSEIADEMRVLFGPVAREKNLELQLIIDPSAPELIVSDKLRLGQILKNLISNALKFTKQGYVKLEISQPADSKMVRFSIKDTGIGIPEDKQKLIFEAFKQADGSTRRKFGGTGLGLSISRELAKLLGGEISLISKSGEGSEFILLIPLSREEKIFQEEIEQFPIMDPEIQAEPSENYTVSIIPNEIEDDRNTIGKDDKTLLIIEDDTKFANTLLNFTRKQGYKGVVVVRGDLGLEMAKKIKPVAILLDIQLPVKDGWQVMEELKQDLSTRHIPVHIMSSMEFKKESLMKGAADFISKPMAFDQMKQIFKKLEEALSTHPGKVLIIEENLKHAKALSYFLSNFNVNSEVSETVSESILLLNRSEVDCVILDMGAPDERAYETLELIKESPGLENLPVIIFTGKTLSKGEESKIKKYADSIIVKTAHSYQRILDEVGIFLHLVENHKKENANPRTKLLGAMNEVLKNKTVLIADDDARNIFSLTKALEKHQMAIVSATDGKEALKILKENADIDIVLMDMMMPEMDGYESTSLIRKIPKYKHLPILAVTAKAMMGDREKCIKAGASDYISKPVDIDQLISLLRVWLYDNSK